MSGNGMVKFLRVLHCKLTWRTFPSLAKLSKYKSCCKTNEFILISAVNNTSQTICASITENFT